MYKFFSQEYNIGSSSYKNSRIQDWSFVLQEHRSTVLEVLTRTQEHKNTRLEVLIQEHKNTGLEVLHYKNTTTMTWSPPPRCLHGSWAT